MTKYTAVNEAVKVMLQLYKNEQIVYEREIAEKEALDWYQHTDFVDPFMLAALAYTFGTYHRITADAAYDIKEELFPTICMEIPVEYTNFSIIEIEASYNDALWRD